MYRILTINPGSTSTKVAIFEDRNKTFEMNVAHDVSQLKQFETISDQLDYRKEIIEEAIGEEIKLHFDAIVGRGGGLMAMEGGVYKIDELLLDHSRRGANGVQHPANLGPQLADYFSKKLNCPCFVVNPPDTDELQPMARLTGIKGVYRNVHLHALNLKETAFHHCEKYGLNYNDSNFIVCHLGGGISISAHRKGKMIDGNDIVGGEGPLTPTRCGSVPAIEIISFLEHGHTFNEARQMCQKTGGFTSLLDTSDAISVSEKAKEKDKVASLAWNTMIYQIEKEIGAMSASLRGDVAAILISGGIAHNKELIKEIEDCCKYIAPVYCYPGEFEMEAMAQGAIRVLNGTEEIKNYTGKLCWDRNDFE